MRWIIKYRSRVDPEELIKKADESLEITRSQQERVNYITQYLERRKNQNGFGEDFEFTLKAKGA